MRWRRFSTLVRASATLLALAACTGADPVGLEGDTSAAPPQNADSALDDSGAVNDSAMTRGGVDGGPASCIDAGCDGGYCAPARAGWSCVPGPDAGQCGEGGLKLPVDLPGRGTTDVCIGESVVLGLPCAANVDCATAWPLVATSGSKSLWRCRWFGAGTLHGQCTVTCVHGIPKWGCPDAAPTCEKTSTHTNVCVGDTVLACPLLAWLHGAEGLCRRSNQFGTCGGVSRCDGYGPGVVPTCDAAEPAAESCGTSGQGDGIDQDCDGTTDEGCTP